MAAFLDCFSSLLSMLDLAEKIEHVKWPEIQEQMEAVRQGKKALEGLKKRSFFLTSKNEASGAVSYTHLDVYKRQLPR